MPKTYRADLNGPPADWPMFFRIERKAITLENGTQLPEGWCAVAHDSIHYFGNVKRMDVAKWLERFGYTEGGNQWARRLGLDWSLPEAP